jgi:hypothetical protein
MTPQMVKVRAAGGKRVQTPGSVFNKVQREKTNQLAKQARKSRKKAWRNFHDEKQQKKK